MTHELTIEILDGLVTPDNVHRKLIAEVAKGQGFKMQYLCSGEFEPIQLATFENINSKKITRRTFENRLTSPTRRPYYYATLVEEWGIKEILILELIVWFKVGWYWKRTYANGKPFQIKGQIQKPQFIGNWQGIQLIEPKEKKQKTTLF